MRAQILKYFWVVTLLFLAGAAILAARLTGVLVAQRLWVGDLVAAPSQAVASAPTARDRLADYRVIQDRNIFNAHPKPAETEKPEPPAAAAAAAQAQTAAAAPRLPLNITLVGTAVVEGGKSFAFIQSGGELKLVKEKDEVAPGARLAKVLPDRIQVDRGGGAMEDVLLYPPEAAPTAARGRPGRTVRQPEPAASSPPSDTVRQVEDGKWLLDSREVEEATANMSKLMTQIRVVPNFTNGQPDGFKVFAIRPGSLFAKIGLQNGDVIKRINGIEIQGPEQAFEAYQRLKDETSIQIDLTRRNENQTFSYEIR